jgi:gluconate 2-dehydrogenase gamma chain
MRHPTRRQILLATGAAIGAVALEAAARVRLSPRPQEHAPLAVAGPPMEPPETLTVLCLAEYFTLAAACERILPRDESPGAMDLGAPVYIDRALGVRPTLPWTDGFREGLSRLDDLASRRFTAPFARVRGVDQDAVLASLDNEGDAESSFLRNLVVATLEGSFSAPTWGGNSGKRGWTDYGFPVDPFAPKGVLG